MKQLLLLDFLIPGLMIIIGYFYKRNPNTDMGQHLGYNTPSSRRSQKHWDYAQSIAPDTFIKYGIISLALILIIIIVFLLLNISIDTIMYFGMSIGFAFMIVSFIIVEKKLSEHFTDK